MLAAKSGFIALGNPQPSGPVHHRPHPPAAHFQEVFQRHSLDSSCGCLASLDELSLAEQKHQKTTSRLYLDIWIDRCGKI